MNIESQIKSSIQDLKKMDKTDLEILSKYLRLNGNIDYEKMAKKIVYMHTDGIPWKDRDKCIRYSKKLKPKELERIRQKIYNHFSHFKNSVYKMSSTDLKNIFQMYDSECFDNDISNFMTDKDFTLKFKTSGEATFTTEGICNLLKCDYTITIPTAPFERVNGVTNVAGHLCKDQLECLQRVIEHELVHLIIFIFCQDGFIADQHGPLFMRIVKDLFNHTDHRHYIF